MISTDIVFQHYIPAKPLSDFVGLFWYWRGHEVEYSQERILPSAAPEVIIKLKTAHFNAAVIAGPRSESAIIERTQQDEFLGIHFNVAGLFPFLAFPCGELHGRNVTLADVWGEQAASEVLCRLHEASSVKDKFHVLELWLLTRARHPLARHRAVAFAMDEFECDSGIASSAVIADRVGFSQRRFIQLFRNEVGLTPKLYCRVQRFRRVIADVSQRSDIDWVDVALSCGYFDQAHFNHDFREFCGLSPTEYLSLRTAQLNHVRVKDSTKR
jgi:AraC-like DNA-binding protein